ncbi:MAG: 16S rRNA (adenine(1518)-N(6)/adenine(1519)-N(6))-dimethyltransferase RsmA [Peptococcaceae bacterium]|nr:16S rRNA (adenine(1518)-N(6)/adenine(1519)-N(6))-dimethyltransferase RsmA [Peptococcaceae bacterium]
MTCLTSPAAVKKLLESYNFRCRKRMGQNFLVDANIVNKIISAALLDEKDTVVEIGPGLGVITRAAAVKAGSVVALELDRGLLPILEETLKDLNNVSIVAGDAMEADLDAIVGSAGAGCNGPYKLIANLPYYITTPLITRLLTSRFNISLYVIMVQQEVAERIAALPGGKEYGALSVAVQYYTEARYLFRVPSTVFYPRPEVDSAVVRLLRRPKPAVKVPDEDLFFKVVRGSFGQRRKTLLNSLSTAFDNIPREKLGKLLEAAGIDPGRRGETLSIAEFAQITGEIYNIGVRG